MGERQVGGKTLARKFIAVAFGLAIASAQPALAEDVGGADLTAPTAPNEQNLPTMLTGTLAKVRASGVIVIGYREASFPFSYLRPGAVEPLGYSIDLCKGIVDEVIREFDGAPVRVAWQMVTVGFAHRCGDVRQGRSRMRLDDRAISNGRRSSPSRR